MFSHLALADQVTGDLSTGLNITVGTTVNGVVVAPPVPSPAAGPYTGSQSVALAATGSTSINYTVDGTTPTCTTGLVYNGAITVPSTMTINALSCYSNGAASTVAGFVYTIIPSSTLVAPAIVTGGGGGGGGGSYTAPTTGSISGLIYSDTNANGVYDPPTDTPLSNWVIYLVGPGDASTTSASNGDYYFGNLAFGNYTVREVPQAGWGQTEPPTNQNNHGFAVTLSSTSTIASNLNFGNNIQGQVLGISTTAAHPDGTLIVDNRTIYLIQNQELYGFRNRAEYFSYGYNFSQAVPANDADRLLPFGGVLKAMSGTVVLDSSDKRTVYIIGANSIKYGFASAKIFKALGYSFAGLPVINLSDYPVGAAITSAAAAHIEGSLVLDSTGTAWWILGGQRDGFGSMAVFNTYNFASGRIVPANAADMALSLGPLVKLRDGTLVQDGGAYYIISDGLALPFASSASLTSWGYNLANAVSADISGYTAGPTLP